MSVTSLNAQSRELMPREIAEKTLRSTVTVLGTNDGELDRFGSGFFIASNLVATNFHVVEGATHIFIKSTSSESIHSIDRVVAQDEINDLAILQVSTFKGIPLKLGSDDSIRIGDTIYAIGSPRLLEGTFSPGTISGFRDLDGARLIQMTAAISSGSSGGPVVDNKGEVVGITVSTFQSGQSLNFAVPVSFLRTLMGQKSEIAATLREIGIIDLNANIRVAPNSKAKILTQAEIGSHFAVVRELSMWIQIWIPGNSQGGVRQKAWISKASTREYNVNNSDAFWLSLSEDCVNKNSLSFAIAVHLRQKLFDVANRVGFFRNLWTLAARKFNGAFDRLQETYRKENPKFLHTKNFSRKIKTMSSILSRRVNGMSAPTGIGNCSSVISAIKLAKR